MHFIFVDSRMEKIKRMASSVTGDVNNCKEKLEKEPGKYFTYLLLLVTLLAKCLLLSVCSHGRCQVVWWFFCICSIFTIKRQLLLLKCRQIWSPHDHTGWMNQGVVESSIFVLHRRQGEMAENLPWSKEMGSWINEWTEPDKTPGILLSY